MLILTSYQNFIFVATKVYYGGGAIIGRGKYHHTPVYSDPTAWLHHAYEDDTSRALLHSHINSDQALDFVHKRIELDYCGYIFAAY